MILRFAPLSDGADDDAPLDGAPLPGNDGEMALPLGSDGLIPSPPPELLGSDGVGMAGLGSAGEGRLGVICICASSTGPDDRRSLIGKFPDRQRNGAFWIEGHPERRAKLLPRHIRVIHQCHFVGFFFIFRA